MNYNDSLVQLIKNLSQNSDDDTDPNNVMIQQFQAPYENNKVGEVVNTLQWGGIPYWAGAFPATFTRNSPVYNLDNTYAGYNPRFVSGSLGKGILIEEATTNLLTNPRLEMGSWWSVSHSGYRNSYTTSPSTDGLFPPGVVGCTSATVATGQANAFLCETPTLALNTAYTVSFYVCVPTTVAAGKAKLSIYYDNSGWNSITSLDIPERGVWVKKTLTFTTNATYPNTIICVGINNGSPGDKVYACFGQLEQKGYATSFTSIPRVTENLTIPTAGVLDPTQGTVEFTITPTLASTVVSTNVGFHDFTWMTDTWHGFAVRRGNSANCIQLLSFTASVLNLPCTLNWSAGTKIYVAVRWNASTGVSLFINGVLKGTLGIFTSPGTAAATLGWRADAGANGNAIYDDLRFSSIARSDAEILSAYQSNQPLPVDAYTTAKYNFDGDLNNSLPILGFNWSQGGRYTQKPEVMACLMLI